MDTQINVTFFEKLKSARKKFQNKLNPGIILIFVALITMIIANSPLRDQYETFWNIKIKMGTEHFNFFNHHGLSFTTLQYVNDAIMTIFFFLVGIEIKREILVGELSTFRQAILPIIAAVGGMIIPVAFFYFSGQLQNFTAEEFKGIAIPMATDIAFSLGVLSMLGSRVPLSLKIFLLALAIVDDIGGIVVIAAFYSEFTTMSFVYLGVSLLFFGLLMLGNKLEIHSKAFYITLGIIIWYHFLQAGIHPTIAGVLVAFTIPSRPHINLSKFTNTLIDNLKKLESTIKKSDNESIVLSNEQVKYINEIESSSDEVISPLQDFEDNLHGWVNYFIMPLFAFANAGVIINFSEFNLFSGVSLSIFTGLFFGKVLGIFSFTWLSLKLKISSMPTGMNYSNLLGVSMLGGIGFTVALFLASLSYEGGSELLNHAKMGIIAGSLFAGLGGYFILKYTLKK